MDKSALLWKFRALYLQRLFYAKGHIFQVLPVTVNKDRDGVLEDDGVGCGGKG